MKLYFLYLSALTVGALCKIDDVCIVQVVSKELKKKKNQNSPPCFSFRLVVGGVHATHLQILMLISVLLQGKKGVEGKCQKKGECMKAGLAAFSKSGRKDISGSVEEVACPGGKITLPIFFFFMSLHLS